ncbi:hypothetical protein PI125_g26602 [Phytophthora idaei]|nr:hypothetical protein PI125_g26602 [Phytophthora idaei]
MVAPNKRSEEGIAVTAQMGASYARMELEGQHWGGWAVNADSQWCPCNYCFVFGVCVHVLLALRATAHVDSSGRVILVSRRKRKRKGVPPRRNHPSTENWSGAELEMIQHVDEYVAPTRDAKTRQ